MTSGGTQNNLRKALGALKDTTTVSLAKVNSDYKVYHLFLVLFHGIGNHYIFIFIFSIFKIFRNWTLLLSKPQIMSSTLQRKSTSEVHAFPAYIFLIGLQETLLLEWDLIIFYVFLAAIFSTVSATRPRADVAYCIHALARRLSRTHNWAVCASILCVCDGILERKIETFVIWSKSIISVKLCSSSDYLPLTEKTRTCIIEPS